MNRRWSRDESGFTLVELVIVIVILGVITIPLANFFMGYLDNYTQTEARMSDSHDAQIATAYFSQDVANTGLRTSPTNTAPLQSIWTSGFPSGYCGSTLGGTTLLLLKWDDWTFSGTTGTDTIDSVAYVVISGTLHRAFCSGSGSPAQSTVVHNLVYPDSANPTPVTCSTSCASSTPPTTVSIKLSIKGKGDSAIWYLTLSGQRRQPAS